MLMTSIRDYIQLKGRADLQDIARHFHIQESAVEQMLSFWVKKGIISKMALEQNENCRSNSCSDCLSCKPESQTIYIWQSSQ